MKRPFSTRIFLPLLALWALAGCILVDDFSEAWNESKPDYCLTKIAESLYYADFRRDPEGKDMTALARGWSLNGNHFLLLKKDAADKGGRLYRFEVENGFFRRYRLNPTMREAFQKEYPSYPTTISFPFDTVTLSTLDAPTLKLLGEIAAKPDYWEIEDQTMYNTMRNPHCRFEDRDLSKLKD
jgi:hypothetical protein